MQQVMQLKHPDPGLYYVVYRTKITDCCLAPSSELSSVCLFSETRHQSMQMRLLWEHS